MAIVEPSRGDPTGARDSDDDELINAVRSAAVVGAGRTASKLSTKSLLHVGVVSNGLAALGGEASEPDGT